MVTRDEREEVLQKVDDPAPPAREEEDEEEEYERGLAELNKNRDPSKMVGIVGYSKQEALMASRIPQAVPFSTSYFAEQHNNCAAQIKRKKQLAEFLAKSSIHDPVASSKPFSEVPQVLATVFVPVKPLAAPKQDMTDSIDSSESDTTF